jgi:hypothetical protein
LNIAQGTPIVDVLKEPAVKPSWLYDITRLFS